MPDGWESACFQGACSHDGRLLDLVAVVPVTLPEDDVRGEP